MANAGKGDEEDMDIPEESAQLDERRQYGHGTLTEKDLDEKYVHYHIPSDCYCHSHKLGDTRTGHTITPQLCRFTISF